MGKKILDSKILYALLSIVLAFGLWLYVASLDGNEKSQPFRNIPVTFVGVDTLEARGLMIVGETPTASVTVRAAPMVLVALSENPISLVVDVSRITEAAEYTMAYTAVLPNSVSSSQVTFESGQTGNVRFTVARYLSREVEVQGQFTGSAAEGYLPGDNDDFLFSPGTVTISGQADLVNQVHHILVTVDGDELTESINGEYPFELIGASGDPLEDLNVTCSVETIYTTFPILATAEIPLEVGFITGGGVDESKVDYKLSTDKITVAGSTAAVSAIKEAGAIQLTTLNLANIRDGDVITCAIPLADELTNLSGVTEVTITISLSKSLEIRQFEVTNINCTGLPEGWEASIVTQVLPVEVRGTTALLDELTADNIWVTADLSEINLTPGQQSVPANVYINSVGTAEQIGALGTDYKIVVNLSKK